MNLASDSSWFAEIWPGLWIGMAVLLGLLIYRQIKKGKWK